MVVLRYPVRARRRAGLDLPHIQGYRQVGNKPGTVGHPIPGVAVKIVDAGTGAPMPDGQDGMLLVSGPNVMKGYLGKPEKTAEVLNDGWYTTGDVAIVDDDGFVKIVDRMSRFSKIGGEMVPHVAIEEKLLEGLNAVSQVVFVTAVDDESVSVIEAAGEADAEFPEAPPVAEDE